ncbi:MAG: aminopeptidase [Lachnospiraceae bacterium]|nr:aminopeptidase [Lachnospiraceae bacterium]
MNEELLRKYADLIVRSGVNVQQGQPLVIVAPVKESTFVEYCAESAYKVGAKSVSVKWSDEILEHMDYEYQTAEELERIPDWIAERTRSEHEDKACYLSIVSQTPGLLADVDQEKVRRYQTAYMQKMEPYRAYTMNNLGQWCVAALPSEGWAKKVFPDKSGDEAVSALLEAILYAVHVRSGNDPVEEWRIHDEELARYCGKLNGFNFSALHFVSEIGTDLTVGLVKDHIWVGGECRTPDGVRFNPNMPTEECFCMPDRNNVNGRVYASKPLDYKGKLIEDFWFEFKDGAVVSYGAGKEQEALKTLLETDEGSKHLGEVALISYDSPISKLGILFYNTLFDENASCHLALGRCYPENIKGGEEMTREELLAAGGNYSMNHVDFMFGTRGMSVAGIQEDGTAVTVFENGNFVI